MKTQTAQTIQLQEPTPNLVEERRSNPRRKSKGFYPKKNRKLVEGLTKSQIVVKYGKKVRIIALQLCKKLNHHVDIDDLISTGFLGLMDATDCFKPSMGTRFETYAEYRIRGSMIDELRKFDWAPRSARDKAKNLEQVSSRLENLNQRTPTADEISEELGIDTESFHKLRNEISSLCMLNIADPSILRTKAQNELSEAVGRYQDTTNPYDAFCRKHARETMYNILCGLPEKEWVVITCYYFRGLTQTDISSILDVSQTRVSQLHTQAITSLRRRLQSEFESLQQLFLLLFDSSYEEYMASINE